MTWDLHTYVHGYQEARMHILYMYVQCLGTIMQVPCHVCTLYFEIERKGVTCWYCEHVGHDKCKIQTSCGVHTCLWSYNVLLASYPPLTPHPPHPATHHHRHPPQDIQSWRPNDSGLEGVEGIHMCVLCRACIVVLLLSLESQEIHSVMR